MMNEKVKKHLTQQYDGIFLSHQIEEHIENYVEDLQSNYLIDKVSPFLKKGSKILDVGSGYGSFTIQANQIGFECFGIEIETFEHAIAKEKAVQLGVDPNQFIHGSALNLPFADEKFDAIAFWNVLEHISDYKKALLEAKRVLKPGGLIFIIAPNYAAFRKEAHYHVPWLPMLPKSIARLYLKLLGRKTSFLDNCIFYINYYGLKKYLSQNELTYDLDINEKINMNYQFQSVKINSLINFLRKFNLLSMFQWILFIYKTNPFYPSIDLVVKK